jgi:hypothetical protein
MHIPLWLKNRISQQSEMNNEENNWYPEVSNENLQKAQNDSITDLITEAFGSNLPSIRKIINKYPEEFRQARISYLNTDFRVRMYFRPLIIEEFINADTIEDAIQILEEHPWMLNEELELPEGEDGPVHKEYVILTAIRFDNMKLFQYIIHHPEFDPNKLYEFGDIQDSILHIVENPDMIHGLLLLPSINPNIQNSVGYTPLHTAVFRGNVEKVKLLLSDPRVQDDIEDSLGRDPYHTASGEIKKLFEQRDKLIAAELRKRAWNRRKHAVTLFHKTHYNERRRKNRRHTLRRRK